MNPRFERALRVERSCEPSEMASCGMPVLCSGTWVTAGRYLRWFERWATRLLWCADMPPGRWASSIVKMQPQLFGSDWPMSRTRGSERK